MPYLFHYVHLMLQDAAGNPLEWASQHLHVIGWPVLVVLAWKARGLLQDATDSKELLVKMANNDLPHITAVMTDLLAEIKGLREDLLRRRD